MKDPRLVLPTRPHRAARQILHALRDGTSSRARARTVALRSAQVANVGTTRLPDPTLLPVIARHLGGEAADYVIGVHLGPPRANRKPVIAIADRAGALVAFAKCGVDPLTDRLVEHETAALAKLTGLSRVTVPTLIAAGEHHGHPYVVQTPVANEPRSSDPDSVVAAQIEVASVGAETLDRRSCIEVINTGWHERLARSLDESPTRAFTQEADKWCAEAGRAALRWGSWHGDWRRTNMAVTRAGCAVWDWERFGQGVPMGYDALHLFLTTRASAVHDLSTLPTDLRDNAVRLLRPFGVTNRVDAELITTGYFLELAGRYLDDDQAHSGARLGAVAQWLLPHLQGSESQSDGRSVATETSEGGGVPQS
jgi:hypothetical protein